MSTFAIVHLEALQRLKGDYSIKVLFVYAGLASHADTDGWCYPGQEAIAKAGAVCTKTVRAHMSTLVEAGLVEIHKQKTDDGKTYYYLPLLDRGEACFPTESRGNMLPVDGEACFPSEGKQVTGQEQTINKPLEQTTSCEPDEEPFQLDGKAKSKTPSLTLDELIQKWNAIDGVVHCRKPTDSRKRAFAARSKEPGWASEIDTALDRVSKSSFLRGQTDRGNWKADIDWILKPDSMTRILEGKYDDAPNYSRRNGGPVQRTPGRVYDD